MVILDTDHISLLEWADSPIRARILERLAAAGVSIPVVTVVSYEEQVRGWMATLSKARSVAEQVEAYRRLLQQLTNYSKCKVLPFDELAAVKFQSLRKLKL